MLQHRLDTETVTAGRLNCVLVHRFKLVLVSHSKENSYTIKILNVFREGSGRVDNSLFRGSLLQLRQIDRKQQWC